MPDFSPECQAARRAHQDADDAHRRARDVYERAKFAREDAARKFDQARHQWNLAQVALLTANRSWDRQIAWVRSHPDLGVPGVVAGQVGAAVPPANAAISSLYQARTPPNFALWAMVDEDSASAWHIAADAMLQKVTALQAVARAAAADADRETTERTAARAALTTARRDEQNAADLRIQARNAVAAALAEARTVCAGQTATHPLGGGGEFEVEPGVLPEHEKAVRDRLEALPAEEKEGLRRISMRDEFGPQKADGFVIGTYSIGPQVIELLTEGHSEEVLKHELGHHIRYERLSDAAIARWKQFYADGSNGKLEPVGKMPTKYATTDDEQGFADVYEHYRDAKRLHPEVQQLIEDLLRELR